MLIGIRKSDIPFVIMIAHRLETIQSADRIIKLENGTAVGQGNYDDLLSEGMIGNASIQNKEED